MGDAGFFKGTSSEQDTRFKDKEKSLLKSINFPKELDQKVDMRKVELSVMRPWITDKIMELLGFEDEVVVEYVNGLLDDPTSPIVDPKKMQINLTGFLESKTGPFMSELWALLLSAQKSPLKVPALFIEQKKEEMRKKEEADLEAQASIKRRQELEEEKERKLAEIRRRERGQGNNRGGHQGFDHSQRNGSRPHDGASGYSGRGNFMPPRGRDSGWGNRGGARVPDNVNRELPPNGKRERSRSRSRTRRDPPPHKVNGASSRRSRSPSRSRYRSRSRSRSPHLRRNQRRRASPSPRPYRRHEDSSRSHRRGSPHRGHRRERPPLPKATEDRSNSPGSPPQPSRRPRSSSRSPPRAPRRQRSTSGSPKRPSRRERAISKTPPRAPRRRDRSISKSPPRPSRRRERSISKSPPRPSRQRRSISRSVSPPRRRVSELSIANGTTDDKLSRRRRSSARSHHRSRSPPRKRARDEYDKRRDSAARDEPDKSRDSAARDEPDKRRDAGARDEHDKRRDAASDARRSSQTLSSVRRSSSDTHRGSDKIDENGDKEKRPAMISIKGRASKSTTTEKAEHPADKSEVNQPMSSTSGEEKNEKVVDQIRSQKLTDVVKERLLREKVKASMNQI
ncbi:hypothetical protein MJO28_015350 [Puccinia striiformis f. sp. tritici]|uniref:Uncharacterized protein n=1 Tax=Puccinia striiformis f. sp. tritici TaxID=168172 RepID=A0ACC0DUB7_9BASI|nr:hypothetical protein MJO28_015350 [Puccinia striiformis f. sp. tritici]